MSVCQSKYFSRKELECKCGCGQCEMDEAFLLRLDSLRWKLNRPVTLTSAYRCEQHNRDEGGVEDSPHTRGIAVDIACTNSQDRYMILKWAFNLGFKGVGVAKTFVHVDDKEGIPRPNTWLYN